MFATRGQVKKWIAKRLGTTADDPDLNDTIEQMRLMIYEGYTRANIVPTQEFCVGLKCYNNTVCDLSDNDYTYGFTLPENLQTVEGVWAFNRGDIIPVYTSWREFAPIDIDHKNFGKQVHKKSGLFPIECDLDFCNGPDFISFISESSEDVGKKIMVHYLSDLAGKEIQDNVILGDNKNKTSQRVVNVIKVVLPLDICGPITVTQVGNGKILSEYSGSEIVPQFSRYMVKGVSGNVYIKASMKYIELRSDYDLVELDDRNIAQHYAQAVAQHDVAKPDGNSVQMADHYQQKAELNLNAKHQQEEGKKSVRKLAVPVVRNKRKRINRRAY